MGIGSRVKCQGFYGWVVAVDRGSFGPIVRWDNGTKKIMLWCVLEEVK